MITGKKIGVDLDGTIYPFEDMIAASAIIFGGAPLSRLSLPEKRGFFERQWGYPRGFYNKMVRQSIDAGIMFWRGEPFIGAWEALDALHRAGNKIYIITARSYQAHGDDIEKATRAWLREWEIPFDGCIFTYDKANQPIDVLIDDHEDNHQAFVDSDKKFLLFRNGLNTEVDHPHSVTSWDEVIPMLDSMFPDSLKPMSLFAEADKIINPTIRETDPELKKLLAEELKEIMRNTNNPQ